MKSKTLPVVGRPKGMVRQTAVICWSVLAVTRSRRSISFMYNGDCPKFMREEDEGVTSVQKTNVGCRVRKRGERGGRSAVSLCRQGKQSVREMQLRDECVEIMN